jgi:SAM-dependent methyltransferase
MNAALFTCQLTTEPCWFESWFDSPYYHALYAHRDEREAAAFIDRLLGRLSLAPGATVADLGCGTGRHARQLAAHGHRVLGLDLSAASMAVAKPYESEDLWFRRQDIRLPFGSGGFDAVFNLFTSFGYFEDLADHVTVVENIARALRPGGCLVLDYLNAHVAERDLRRTERVIQTGVSFHLSRWTDATHLFKRIEVHDGAATTAFTERVAKFTRDDFRFLFELSGLTLEATFGDYELNPFNEDVSPRLVLVARKPVPHPLTDGSRDACECD